MLDISDVSSPFFVHPAQIAKATRSRPRRRGESLTYKSGTSKLILDLSPSGRLQRNLLETPTLVAEAVFRDDGSPLQAQIEAKNHILISWEDGISINGCALAELGELYEVYRKTYEHLSQAVQKAFQEHLNDVDIGFVLPPFPSL